MALDIKKMKERLGNQKKGSNVFFSVPKGESIIRIVPFFPNEIATNYFLHYGINKNPAFLCPKRTDGEYCAVCDFASQMWKENDPESQKMAKSLFVKKRFYSPIVVRGSENEKEIKWWGYPETLYNEICGICDDPSYGDISDIENGTDLILKSVLVGKNPFPKLSIKAQRNTSKLFTDISDEECKKLLGNIPDILQFLYKKTPDQVQELVNKCFLSEGDAEEVSKETRKYSKSSKEENLEDEKDDIAKAFDELENGV